MTPEISRTDYFYAGPEDPSLFWEMTVCQSLADPEGSCQAALARPGRYGEILARYLEGRIGLEPGWSVVEVGGGSGSLMAALLDTVPLQAVTMVDLSPFFTRQQRRALGARSGCRFVTADAFDFFSGLEGEVDLVVSNENIGDLPTVVGIERTELEAVLRGGAGSAILREVAEKVRRYGLDLDGAPDVLHFNLGAVRYLESLYPRARRVFLSEHGSDTVLPPGYDFLPLDQGDGYPRRVRLKGHDEYTIRFAHLERAARGLGYRVERFHLAELLDLRRDPGIRCMARTRITATEVAEAVHEFCAHVAEYQCMLLTR